MSVHQVLMAWHHSKMFNSSSVKTSRGKGQVCCMAAVLYLATATLSIATVGWATFNIAVKHELDGGLMGGGYDYHCKFFSSIFDFIDI